MSSYEFERALAVHSILKAEGTNPSVASKVQAAFDGDIEAAFGLSCFLENHNCGTVALMMWRGRVKREAFRAYFASVWNHDHHHVIQAAKTRRVLAAMFRYADFPKPADMPERLTVWRGTSRLPQRDAVRGYSWTWERDIACWFAMRFAENNGCPLVLRAEINRADVALFHDDRSEREAVLLRPPAAVVCGDVADWQTAANTYEAAKNERQRAMLQPDV